MRQLIHLALLLFVVTSGFAQEASQSLRGTIKDQASGYPVPGAYVELIGKDTIYKTLTDFDGLYEILDVLPGTYELRVTMAGYETQQLSNIQIVTGKSLTVDVPVTESVTTLEGVVIDAGPKSGAVGNKDATVSSRAFTPEETQRYPGSFDDPARMAGSFAGVAVSPVGSNEIIVRGNSPRGILWRIDGVESPSPNHFSNLGASGGAIGMLTNNALGNSDFYTSAFPSQYGNASSGVFDINLRRGNKDKPEYMVDLNTLGLRTSMEGAFKKDGNATYNVNYRYSTLGLLDKIGVDVASGVPKYQDLSYKLYFPTKNAGTFSVFGLLGQSGINSEESAEKDEDLIVYKGKVNNLTGITGLNHLYFFNDQTSLKSSIAVSGIYSKQEGEDLLSDQITFRPSGAFENANTSVLFHAILNRKINAKHTLTGGVYYDQLYYNVNIEAYDASINGLRPYLASDGSTGMARGFANWNYTPHPNWKFVMGAHYTNFLLNNSQSVEPRFGADWKFAPKHRLSMGYGLHSKREDLSVYFVEIADQQGVYRQLNKDVDLQKSHQMVLGHEVYLRPDFRIKTEVYYQYLYDLLVEDKTGSSYALINQMEGIVDRKLVNDGVGKNYGVELTAEKFFTNQYFMLFTSSLFNSKYKAKDEVWRNTRYNMNYVFNAIAGKDFDVGNNKKKRTLTTSVKCVYAGGNHETPIDFQESVNEGQTVREESLAFSEKMPDVFKLDVQIKLTTNRAKSTRVWFVDIQNVTNNDTPVFREFQAYDNSIITYNQLEIIPMLGYKIIF